ncbi:MAG: addiction module protein [bacterium]
MNIDLPLGEMSTEEKMLLLEKIWDNLRESEEDFSSPDWHKEVLAERKEAVGRDESKFIDWDEAKENIRDAIR